MLEDDGIALPAFQGDDAGAFRTGGRAGILGEVDIARLRTEYETAGIDPDELDPDPILQWRNALGARGCSSVRAASRAC